MQKTFVKSEHTTPSTSHKRDNLSIVIINNKALCRSLPRANTRVTPGAKSPKTLVQKKIFPPPPNAKIPRSAAKLRQLDHRPSLRFAPPRVHSCNEQQHDHSLLIILITTTIHFHFYCCSRNRRHHLESSATVPNPSVHRSPAVAKWARRQQQP